jgi:hypothetical protein
LRASLVLRTAVARGDAASARTETYRARGGGVKPERAGERQGQEAVREVAHVRKGGIGSDTRGGTRDEEGGCWQRPGGTGLLRGSAVLQTGALAGCTAWAEREQRDTSTWLSILDRGVAASGKTSDGRALGTRDGV